MPGDGVSMSWCALYLVHCHVHVIGIHAMPYTICMSSLGLLIIHSRGQVTAVHAKELG